MAKRLQNEAEPGLGETPRRRSDPAKLGEGRGREGGNRGNRTSRSGDRRRQQRSGFSLTGIKDGKTVDGAGEGAAGREPYRRRIGSVLSTAGAIIVKRRL
eukprot:2966691-Rhodomonas_salina.5